MPDNISELLGSITPETMEQMQRMAQNLFGNGDEKQTVPPSDDGFSINPEMLGKLQGLLNRNTQKDSRATLIEAIKPHLSESRRRKADEALGFLRAMELLPLLQSMEL
ncbi:MAG: hypothetical protein FWG82_05555 [Oscillospiraceae bacterium]|nr:hypothetical protein [Oscillospiraceae bacterium]